MNRQRHCEPAGRRNLLILASMLIAACTAEEPPVAERQDPVVVYAAFEDDAAIVEAFDRYKEETGVLVIVRRGPPERIINDLIENNITPPADLVMTNSVVDAWHAAEESALRPFISEAAADNIPEWARDPDNLWFGTATRAAVLAFGGKAPSVQEPEDLSDEKFAGQLCLSSSRNAINRAVIATLIHSSDLRSAEITVRGWIANLALPPFDTEADMLAAIAEGRCTIGIASRSAASQAGLSFLEFESFNGDVEALGVARHAQNPDGAAALAEWLIRDVELDGDTPLVRANLGLVAWHYEDAVKLAERARYP